MTLPKTVFLMAAVSTLIGAGAPTRIMDPAAYDEPARAWSDVEDAEEPEDCRTRIEQVRERSGLPRLDRRPASVNDPVLHYAVDRTIYGCRVLVPVGDPAGVLPPPEAGTPALMPVKLQD